MNRDPLISYFTIGWSSTEPADRFVSKLLRRIGWRAFVRWQVQPQIDWGVRRVMVHSPFGISPVTRGMEFDAAITAKEAGADWLLDEFVDAWAPLVAQGIEVIAYLGTLNGLASFAKMSSAGWWQRAWESLKLPVSAGLSIAFDASSTVEADNPVNRLFQMLDLSSIRMYVEAWPSAAAPNLWKRNWIIEENFYQTVKGQLDAGVPQGKWAAPRSQLTGECVRLVIRPPQGKRLDDASWIVAQSRRVIADGDSVATVLDPLMHARLSRSQFFGG